jgi:glycosyltransferase involved in cell wall biosynthesis
MRKHIEIIKVLDFTSEEREFIRTHLSDVPCTEYARVTQEDIGKVYREADALIFASIYEGFGMPIVEAMACGTPVITSNCSSMPEV